MDRLFSTFDLGRRQGYRAFLEAQAAALIPLETALDQAGIIDVLPDWPLRRRAALLQADLSLLGGDVPALIARPLELHTPPEILGAAYVLEGSRLGAAVLSRRLPPDVPASFLLAPQEPESWRKLLEMLDVFLHGSETMDIAILSAKRVFALFEVAGLRHQMDAP